jgi:hypothetical protein
MSLIQTVFSIIGEFLGSFVFIWLISTKFSSLFNKTEQIITVQIYLLCFSGLGFIIFGYMHFTF